MNTENKNHGFLKDSKGQSSSTRAAMMLCVVVASYLAIAGLHKGTDLITLTGLCVTFLGAGFTAKVAQKGRAND
jgi:hypothetical protein